MYALKLHDASNASTGLHLSFALSQLLMVVLSIPYHKQTAEFSVVLRLLNEPKRTKRIQFHAFVDNYRGTSKSSVYYK